MKKLTIEGNTFIITDTDTDATIRHPKEMMRAEDYGTIIHFYFTQYATQILEYEFSLLVDEDENPFGSIALLFDWLDNNIGSIAKNGAIDVVIQDSTSPLIIIKASELKLETISTVLAVKDAYSFTVASVVGAIIGHQFSIYSVIDNRYSVFTVLNIVGNVVTIDSPIDFAYKIGSFVQFGNTNLAVDGL